jgi:adenylate cyclase
LTIGTEIERKYIIKSIPSDITMQNGKKILQGYLSKPEDSESVRLRKKGSNYYKTWKSKGNILRREKEVEISEKEFIAEWDNVIGNKIEKIRYEIPYKSHIIELDKFDGDLDGLILAEVEFSSLHESNLFIPPSWFGAEVTSNSEFKNSNLAYFGLPIKLMERTNW